MKYNLEKFYNELNYVLDNFYVLDPLKHTMLVNNYIEFLEKFYNSEVKDGFESTLRYLNIENSSYNFNDKFILGTLEKYLISNNQKDILNTVYWYIKCINLLRGSIFIGRN